MDFLHETLLFLAAAVIVVPLFKHLGLGAVLGYLAAGIAIGPWGLAWITDVESILHLSELGVVLLLFVIGLELKPSRLRVLRRAVFGMGALQVGLTTLLLWPLALWWLGSVGQAFLVAVVLALSSTAIGLQMLAEKNQLTTPFGRQAFGILLFQDLAVIPLLALIPLFGAGNGEDLALSERAWAIARAVGIIALVVVGGRYLLRPAFRIIAAARVHEIFIGAGLLLVMGVAVLMEWVGLSMALGAFLAGVLLADSEYRHELEGSIDPFKGLLLGLFFIAVGMSIDFGMVGSEPLAILAIVLALWAVKLPVLLGVGRIAGLSRPGSLALAFSLAQGGEFAFVLFNVALAEQVLPEAVVAQIIVAVTISMALTPLAYLVNEKWIAPRIPGQSEPEREHDAIDHDEPPVIIAGFGRVGQIVARNLAMLEIPFTALDNNPEHVEFVRRFGNKIFFGDATRVEVLHAAGADTAKVFVLAISDIDKSVNTALAIRHHFPHIRIYARARNRRHELELRRMGIDFTVRETLYSSLAMSKDVLQALGVAEAEAAVDLFRRHDEQTLLEQMEVMEDEEAVMRVARRSRGELEDLFHQDPRFGSGRPGEGEW